MPRKATGRTTKLLRIPLQYENQVKDLIAQLQRRDSTEVEPQQKPKNSRAALTSSVANE
jgi:hypothetical protein